MTILPSGEKTTEVTANEWPASLGRAVSVAAIQSLTVLSLEADATTLPSDKRATEVTTDGWLLSLWRAADRKSTRLNSSHWE